MPRLGHRGAEGTQGGLGVSRTHVLVQELDLLQSGALTSQWGVTGSEPSRS